MNNLFSSRCAVVKALRSPGLLLSVVASPVFCSHIAKAAAFSTYEDAKLVIGQQNFTSNSSIISRTTTPSATDVAVSSKGVVAISQQFGRISLFNSFPKSNGTPADVEVGEENFDSNAYGTTASLMSGCESVAFSPDGNKLIASDFYNNRILIWNSIPTQNGQAADVVIGQNDFTSSGSGTSATQLNGPGRLVVTPSGQLIVCDLRNSRVLVYNSIPTQNSAAADVVIGQNEFTTNTSGIAANQLSGPNDIAVSPAGQLLVADTRNNRVLVYDAIPTQNGASASVVIGQEGFSTSSIGRSATKISGPAGIAVSALGQLAVSDRDNNRVLIYNRVPTSNGAAADVVIGQANFGSSLSVVNAKTIGWPQGLTFTPWGQLLATGILTHRVLLFGDSPAISTQSLPTGYVDENYSVQLAGTSDTGGSIAWSFAGGTLPPGLNLSSDGLISGVPQSRGTFSFTVRADDGQGHTSTKVLSLQVIEARSLVVTRTDDVVADDGSTSLREALDSASTLEGTPTITFDRSVFASPHTMTLTGGTLALVKNVNIEGPGSRLLVLRASNISGIFSVRAQQATISGLTIGGTDSEMFYDSAVAVWGGTCTFNQCVLKDNFSRSSGAAISMGNATLYLNGCTLSNNKSTGSGGALSVNEQARAFLSNCTLTRNTATYEPGAITNAGRMSLTNCTLTLNEGKGGGRSGAIYNQGRNSTLTPELSLSNCIVAGNGTLDIVNNGTYLSQGNNLLGVIQGVTNGSNDQSGVTLEQLKLGTLGDNGGPTPTVALLAGSAAIDAGQTELATDQRGVARPQRGSDDIGAFEYQNSAPVLADVSIEQSAPKTKDTLTVAIGTQSDADGDTLTRTYQWKKNGVPIEGQTGATLDLSVAGNGDKGDKISVVVTATDGTDSVSQESPEITVVNSAPSITNIRIHKSDTADFPRTLDYLLVLSTVNDDDGDQVTQTYRWNKNGQEIATATKNPLLLKEAGNGDRGDTIFAVVTASDGTDETSAETTPLTVLNTPPTPFRVDLTTSGSERGFTDMVLTATLILENAAKKADDDDDSLTTTYVWKKNGVVLEGETGASLDLSKAGNGDKNDAISVTVTRTDGVSEPLTREASTKVYDTNAVPTAVKITPASPKTNDVLRAVVQGFDPDGDTPAYWFRWTKNGETLSADNSGILDLGQLNGETTNGDKGDVISVYVQQMFGSYANITDSVKVVNSAPTLTPASFKAAENTTFKGKVVAQDADGDAVTLSVVRTTGRGKLELTGDGSFTYTPLVNFNGTDGFIVKATDAEGAISTATYSISVAASNGVPVPVNDVVSGYEDVPLTIPAATLLRNDSNGELRGEVDDLKIVRVAVPAGFPGVLRFDVVKQTITFTPKLNWSGNTLFVYTVQDSKRALASAQVDLKIAPVNDAPVAVGGRMTLVSGTLGELKLSGSDAENSVLTFGLSARAANGAASVVKVGADWVLRYQSKAGFSGTDTVAVVARDGKLNSAPATITITVVPNSAPQLVSLNPNRGTVASGTSIVFEQRVRDANGTAHLDAVALVPSASATALVTRGGAAIWFDAITNQFTMTKDDGKTTFAPVGLGRTLENAQMRVTLGSTDVIRGSNGILALRWRITFKPTYLGVKSLWGRVEDQGGLSAGFTNIGQITVGSSANGAFNPSAAGS